MKLKCLRINLLKAVQLAEKTTAKNLSLSSLSNIILEVKDSGFKIRSTNLDLGLIIDVPAKISSTGDIAIIPQILLNFLNNINDEEIELNEENGNIKINSKNAETLIKGQNCEDFPDILKIENKDIISSLKINSQIINEGLKSTLFASSISDIKPEISSVYIFSENKDLYFVSTDSFRLAEKKFEIGDKNSLKPIILPFKNATEIQRILENKNENLLINLSKEKLEIKGLESDFYIISRIINGIYPDYKQIMPNKFKTSAFIDRDELLRSLKISGIFSDKLNQIKLKINSKESKIEFFSQSDNVGQNTIKIPIEVDGEDQEVNFNVKYLIDCLNIITSNKVSLRLNEKNKPVLINGLEKSFSYLIMPINR